MRNHDSFHSTGQHATSSLRCSYCCLKILGIASACFSIAESKKDLDKQKFASLCLVFTWNILEHCFPPHPFIASFLICNLIHASQWAWVMQPGLACLCWKSSGQPRSCSIHHKVLDRLLSFKLPHFGMHLSSSSSSSSISIININHQYQSSSSSSSIIIIHHQSSIINININIIIIIIIIIINHHHHDHHHHDHHHHHHQSYLSFVSLNSLQSRLKNGVETNMCQGSENPAVKLLQVRKAKRPIADTAVKTIGGCSRTLTLHMMTRYLTHVARGS